MDNPRPRRGRGGGRGGFRAPFGDPVRGDDRGDGGHPRGQRGGRGGGRGGRGRGDGRPRQEREVRIGFLKLVEFEAQEGSELLQIAINKNSGIPWLLKQPTVKSDWIYILLSILAKACRVSSNPASLMILLTDLRNSAFFKQVLVTYLTQMMTESDKFRARDFKEPLGNVLPIFQALLQSMPSCVHELIPLTTTTELVVRTLRASNYVVDTTIDDELEKVTHLRDQALTRGVAQRRSGVKAEEVEEQPPGDFRELSIFPTTEDIHTDELPFLRANRIRGQYRDLDHYLDVQFRLLREDFLGPLRGGIKEFLDHRRDANHRYQDIRLYQNVQILNPVCHPSGISYRIRFDVSRLPRVRWESTRRLIYGSLVCLSSDDFRTQLFATVANRSPEGLAEGQLEVMFQANHREVSRIPPDQSFNMAETSAYFEAYRHVLSGLQNIGNDFPFAEYIIKCNNNIKAPGYLRRRESTAYDLRCLVDENCTQVTAAMRMRQTRHRMRRLRFRLDNDSDSNSDNDSDSDSDLDDGTDVRIESRSNGAAALEHVKILDPRQSWPSEDHFKLDSSQRDALIAALTKEMVLIQGPPGTGKTYLGLKIVRALIQNQTIWRPNRLRLDEEEQQQSPILVVCYTNHALDQFLEGIAKFLRRGIVRVGGRCKSEELEQFKLAKQRYALRDGQAVPRHIRDGRFDSWNDMQRCKEQIEQITFRIGSLDNGLLHEDDLQRFMADEHFDSLLSQFTIGRDQSFGGRSRQFTIFYHWLGLDGTIVKAQEDRNAQRDEANAAENAEAEDEEDELIDVENENEKEALERMIGEDHQATPDEKAERRRRDLQQLADGQLALQLSQLEDEDESNGQENNFGEWQQPRRKKGKTKNKTKKIVKRELISQDIMTEEETGRTVNVWNLSTKERWRLYRYWVNLFRLDLKEGIRGHEDTYHMAAERHKEVLEDEDRLILQSATVVGMTTTCAAKYRRTLQLIRPKVIIVEEAAEVLEAHIVTTLSPGCEHLILIGDHQQLRPNPNVYELAEKYKLKISLFERLIMNNIPCKTLERQHRMRPEISDVLQHIYPGLKDDESVMCRDDVKGVSKNMFFISHSEPEKTDDEMKSKSNAHEAHYVACLCWYLLLQGYSPEQITILTPYTGQLLAIRKRMPKKQFEGVRVTAVDNFQGEENDIIILSLVRSNSDGNIGFLKDDNRVCVALSRAKIGFYVIGNFELFALLSRLWGKVVQTLKQNGCIGAALPLYCQNHPESGIEARKAADFQKAPEGGCQRPCEARLDCGHVCVLACHTYDIDHKNYKCQKPCNKVLCERDHRCRKTCSADCGKCTIRVSKVIPRCGHVQQIPCSTPAAVFTCQAKCRVALDCGHPCQNHCGEPHTTHCLEQVEVRLACGHQVLVRCCDEKEDLECPVPCKTRLSCEHPCQGSCGKCFEGRLHQPCRNGKCGRVLVCGHECKDLCTASCPPCKVKCRNSCVHSRCLKECGQPCNPCIEPCAWQCPHHRCNNLCYEPCDRPRCDLPCPRRLRCGHPCIGLCGETCPKKCRVCNKEEVETILFGDEDEPGARFVMLEDCQKKCTVEVGALDRWMETDVETDKKTIQMKLCPICSTAIRKNLRYGNIVKGTLRDLEGVKEQVTGGRDKIEVTKLQYDAKERHLKSEDKLELRKKLDNPYLNLEQATAIVNSAEFFVSLTKSERTWGKVKTKLGIIGKDNPIDKLIIRLRDFIHSTQRHSDQLVGECSRELNRVRMMVHVACLKERAKLVGKLGDPEVVALLKGCAIILSPKNKLEGENVSKLRELVKSLEKILPENGLAVTEEERVKIISAVGLSKGHWFKCPNGHIYCIGECGGAMVTAKCPECDATIGGANHALRSDNALAREMDGARHAAWSDAANADMEAAAALALE